MSRSKNSPWEWVPRAEAEDRAVVYLTQERWSPQVSMAIAIRVEFFLAVRWEEEQEVMRHHDDPREVIEIVPREMQEARTLFARTPPGISNAAAEQHVVDMLTKFPLDRAWWISRRVRRYVVHHQENQMRRPQELAAPPPPDGKLPSSIRRPATLAEAAQLATHGDQQKQ
jgi:hypothetical protein